MSELSRSLGVQAPRSNFTEILPQESGHTIFDYYSVKNDVLFLKKMPGVSREEKRFYLQENVMKFLGEFVGEVPYTKISYLLKPGVLEFGGINIARVYQEAAEFAGTGSREDIDWQGFQKIQHQFVEGEDNIAYWVSPPKIADYSFTFIMAKNGQRVDEYMLRFDETRGKLDKSNQIQKMLTGQTYEKTEDFIKNPTTYFSPNVGLNLQTLLAVTGLDTREIQDSFKFEERVKSVLLPWINLYAERILELAEDTDLTVADFSECEKELEVLLAAIYNKAHDLKDGLDVLLPGVSLDGQLQAPGERAFYNVWAIHEAANSRSLKVAGGDCPVSKEKGNNFGFVSGGEIIENLKAGNTVENLYKKETESWDYERGTCAICEKTTEIGPCSKMCRDCEKIHFWPKVDGNE